LSLRPAVPALWPRPQAPLLPKVRGQFAEFPRLVSPQTPWASHPGAPFDLVANSGFYLSDPITVRYFRMFTLLVIRNVYEGFLFPLNAFRPAQPHQANFSIQGNFMICFSVINPRGPPVCRFWARSPGLVPGTFFTGPRDQPNRPYRRPIALSPGSRLYATPQAYTLGPGYGLARPTPRRQVPGLRRRKPTPVAPES